MTKEVFTKVDVSFFRPTGYLDTYYVRTANRGLAMRTVIATLTPHESHYLNDLYAKPSHPKHSDTPVREDHVLDPIENHPSLV